MNVTADADPDPTTQMAWPTARHSKRASESAEVVEEEFEGETRGERSSSSRKTDNVKAEGKKRMSMMDLFNLSVSMGGAQIAWTVELGYVAVRFVDVRH